MEFFKFFVTKFFLFHCENKPSDEPVLSNSQAVPTTLLAAREMAIKIGQSAKRLGQPPQPRWGAKKVAVQPSSHNTSGRGL